MPDSITIKGMKARAARFLAAKNFEALAKLLRKPPLRLVAIAANPQYKAFDIPKKNGGKRHIENPLPELKKIQRKLNDYFQAVYYFHRTDSAYGFLSAPKDDLVPRNILTNAQQHIGCKWMLNVDMKDFFHQIAYDRLVTLFQAPIFDFNEEVSVALAALCCYKGRLPMGAPTSPILSNLVVIPLDHDLEHFAASHGMRYTRYADDLTFSSTTVISNTHFETINQWIDAYDLFLNPKKIKFYLPDDGIPKEVTGLVVGDTEVYLSEEYQLQLAGAIEHLSIVVDAQHLTPSGQNNRSVWVKELQQQVKGKMEFAKVILGETSPDFLAYADAYQKAVEPPEHFGPLSWLDFGYAPIHFLT